MASDTYGALVQAGPTIGTEASAIPYSEISPFVDAFNRAKNGGDKTEQLKRLDRYIDGYRGNNKDNGSPSTPKFVLLGTALVIASRE